MKDGKRGRKNAIPQIVPYGLRFFRGREPFMGKRGEIIHKHSGGASILNISSYPNIAAYPN